ncbi:DegT/DnrJ/EryC1/StrS family aminotransferase [Nocardia sp. NPDC050412]|uniref:DegT/DnrJ/EryC1/StrS family aminotransferase n=1 Tax=Nocardia sp. NPDC050412 TaxID=3364320 RepID=UPI00379649AB
MATVSTELALLGGAPVVDRVPSIMPPAVGNSDLDLIADLVRRGETAYVGHEGQVGAFEEEFKRYAGTTHALAVNSGTSALYSAFFGIGLTAGDEVLAPTYTFLATVMPIFAVNAVPVLVDVDASTGNLDPDDMERHVTSRTRAIVVTHLNGVPADMDVIMPMARRHGLAVVEDCSQAHGAVCSGMNVGSFGDAGAFSLQAKKTVTAGTGGILITDNQRVYERAVMLGHFLDRAEEDVRSAEYAQFATTGFGLNLRMHPLGAVLARSSLRQLDDILTVRQRNYEHMDRLLTEIPGVQPPVRRAYMDRVSHYSYQPLYRSDELGGLPIDTYTKAVAAEGVPLSRPRSGAMHQQPAFQDPAWDSQTFSTAASRYRRYRGDEFPGSATYLAHALRLPVHSIDIRPDLDRWAEALSKVAANVDKLKRAEGI